jgi:hypothetical protein
MSLVNTAMEKLIEHKQKSLVVDMAEYYFKNWVKETREFDEFFKKICILAFKHGDDEHKISFIKQMININRTNSGDLAEVIAEEYKQRKDYYRSYVYSILANAPHLTLEMLEQIIKNGYPNETDLFKLRAVLEYMIIGKLESATILIEKLWDKEESNPFKNMANAIWV